MQKFLRDNGLTLVITAVFLLLWLAQAVAGWCEHSNQQREKGKPAEGFGAYLLSGDFWEATGENWESEFLQMGFYVVLTSFLYQRGSSESKDPDEDAPQDEDAASHQNDPKAPWPVRKGGLWLRIYGHSLSLTFMLLFLMSVVIHMLGGAVKYNQQQMGLHQPTVSPLGYLGTSQFWSESFQNWQSEFLAMASMVFLSIFLRQKGSPESKPVHAPHWATGE